MEFSGEAVIQDTFLSLFCRKFGQFGTFSVFIMKL